MVSILKPTESLMDYYVLPLLGINKHSFGERYYTGSFLTQNGELVVVLNEGCPVQYWHFEYFKTDFERDGKVILLFNIPEKFYADLRLFVEGKFSKMSNFAKDLIYKNSGLYYKKKIGDVIVTSKILLALTKSKLLKDWVRDEYGIEVDEDEEYFQIPGEEIIYNL